MHRARHLIGLTVYGSDRKKLGDVSDVIFDPHTRYVQGLVVTGGTVIRRPRYVKNTDIAGVGADSVLLCDGASLSTEVASGLSLAASGSPVGKRITTTGGSELGDVRDVLLQDGSLDVWGFEVSDGLVRDFLEGTQQLPRQLVRGLTDVRPAHMNEDTNGKPSRGGGEHP